MERRRYLNLEPVTFVGTYAASLPVGNAESSRPAVLGIDLINWSVQPVNLVLKVGTSISVVVEDFLRI